MSFDQKPIISNDNLRSAGVRKVLGKVTVWGDGNILINLNGSETPTFLYDSTLQHTNVGGPKLGRAREFLANRLYEAEGLEDYTGMLDDDGNLLPEHQPSKEWTDLLDKHGWVYECNAPLIGARLPGTPFQLTIDLRPNATSLGSISLTNQSSWQGDSMHIKSLRQLAFSLKLIEAKVLCAQYLERGKPSVSHAGTFPVAHSAVHDQRTFVAKESPATWIKHFEVTVTLTGNVRISWMSHDLGLEDFKAMLRTFYPEGPQPKRREVIKINLNGRRLVEKILTFKPGTHPTEYRVFHESRYLGRCQTFANHPGSERSSYRAFDARGQIVADSNSTPELKEDGTLRAPHFYLAWAGSILLSSRT